jgi:ABC-2 type transport system permease protein
MWKERKTLFRGKGSRLRYLLMLLSPLVLATVFPITWGPDWVAELPPLALAFIVPAMLVGVTVPESFAGERERHTLDTLLASRLPDRAILLGKLITPVVLSCGVTLLLLLASLVVVNLAHSEGQVLMYTLPIGLGSLAMCILVSMVAAAGGVLVSLRSATVQEASQKLLALLLAPLIVLQVVPLFLIGTKNNFIERINGVQLLIIVLVVLAAIGVVLMALVAARFQRSKLVLD